MSLQIVKWQAWQGPAVKKLKKDRARAGGDSRRRLRLDFIRVATSFEDPAFMAFAEAVGGRAAVGFWMAILQHVALHDPEGGTLGAVTRARLADQVLSTPWDRVKPGVGAKVWDALVACGLAVDNSPPEEPRGSGTVYPSGPGADPPPDTPRDGPIEEPQGITSETRGATRARRATLDVDVEETSPVVASRSDPPRAREATAGGPVNGGPGRGRPPT
ncbi:MAG: hypothetical protein HUU06_05355, partial [Planctomycetaceae bacterium]|nr:hypothetical protein [Planctomycetaceae bacterium]